MDYKKGQRTEQYLLGFFCIILLLCSWENVLADEIEQAVSITAIVPGVTSGTTGGQGQGGSTSGGGGGGNSLKIPSNNLIVQGSAYAPGVVSLFKEGRLVLKDKTSDSGAFNLTLENIGPGKHNFSMTLEDSTGKISNPQAFSVVITEGITTLAKGFYLSAAPVTTTSEPHDLNSDAKINIVDFSILAYWIGRPSPPPKIDLNRDGKINLVDMSILVYYWTGS